MTNCRGGCWKVGLEVATPLGVSTNSKVRFRRWSESNQRIVFALLVSFGVFAGFYLGFREVHDIPDLDLGEPRVRVEDGVSTIQVTVENISKVTTYCPDIFVAALDRDGLDLSRALASPDLGSSRIEPGRVSNYVGILADISETDLREQLDEYVAYVKRDNPC